MLTIKFSKAVFVRPLLFLMLGVGFMKAEAQSQPVQYDVRFFIRNMGISVEGTLNQVEGEFNFDPTDPEKSAIQLQFALSGLSTGNRLRDRHLRSSDYFDAAQWPNIVFSSDSVVAKGSEQWVLHGQLRIKGVKRKLSLPFELKKRPLGGFEAVGLTTLNRREYGVGGKSFILSDEVRVKILVLVP